MARRHGCARARWCCPCACALLEPRRARAVDCIRPIQMHGALPAAGRRLQLTPRCLNPAAVCAAAPALQPRRCLPRQQPQQQQQQQLTSSSRRRLQQQPLRPAAAASPSPNSGAGGDWSWHSVDENPASSSQAEDGPLAAGTGSAAGSGAPKESAFLALPLLIASSLSHVNRQYIRMRRRRNWWRKLGGYPRVRRRR